MSNDSFVLKKPTISRPSSAKSNPDPVKEHRKNDNLTTKKEKEKGIIHEKASIISRQIEPTLSLRIGLKGKNEPPHLEEPKPKYQIPKTKRHQKFLERNRKNTAKWFCKYGKIKLATPISDRKLNKTIDVPSPETSKAKVAPRRATPTASRLYPPSQLEEHLGLKKPLSGIFINENKGKGKENFDYDSFQLVYKKQPRPDIDWTGGKRKKKKRIKPVLERDEEKLLTETDYQRGDDEISEETAVEEEMFGEGDANITALENYLTKQFRRKVSMMSQKTSYNSQDIRSILSEKVEEEPPLNKYIQKLRRDSEIKKYEFKRRKFKRGTLQSHSFTNLNQEILKDFFFGVTKGTLHQGDNSFSSDIRNKQGLCMSVAAYCFSIVKHPNKWTSDNVDQILEFGNQLSLDCIKCFHIHEDFKKLNVHDLTKYCVVGQRKVRFVVEDPEVVGHIRSIDKTIYNLTKALKIFFARNVSGILETEGQTFAIWKDKYYYFFDAKPRTRDLYVSSNGTALMANFYDIPSLATVFLGRSNIGNWPFVIYPLKALRLLHKDDPEVESKTNLDVISNYNILNEKKAVCLGSFDLGDKCFDFSRGKQSLAMAVISLVYSRITPSSAWHRSTVDKIMILGNQFFLECKQCEEIDDLPVDNLPAFFTIGPYIVEIYIYPNIIADHLYKQCCCMLECSLDEFFQRCTNGIIQIDRSRHIAIWKQRNLYFCFDPYSRNNEGYACRNGAACVSMHVSLESLIDTISKNFDGKDSIFYIHALKVCKIHRDPVQTHHFPKHLPMDDVPLEELKKFKMKKSKKCAVEKPVSVDYTALAMIRILAGQQMESSIHEIGSGVDSIAFGAGTLCPMSRKTPSLSILKDQPKIVDVIADLDSPSLSDMQVPPPFPKELKLPPEEIEFLDLDSFELTMEEIELEEISPEEEHEGRKLRKRERLRSEIGQEMEEEEEEEEEGYEGGEDDWYYTMDRMAQASIPKDPSKLDVEMNTDVTFFAIKREVLYPTYLRGKQQMKYHLERYKFAEDDWDTYLPPEPIVTQSQELQKETNFIKLPDDTEIVYGTKNVADFGKDIEFVAPFISIMACVVSKKYSILSWTSEIVDYILKCGVELYSASKFRFDQVSKMEIPKITLGNNCFAVLVEYVFDTYTRQNIVELAIEKILFIRSDIGVLVTPVYACALLYKNHLYYLYDCFGNNEVGLGEGPSNNGKACVARFKDIRSLAARIMYNKRKREANEDVIYSRFVLSSIRVKEKLLSQEEIRKKQNKKSTKPDTIEEGEEAYDFDEITEGEQNAENTDSPKEKEQKLETKETTEKNKVGYQYKNKVYVIEGTKALEDKSVSVELKQDHFICLCACLMLMTCPVSKWDTKKVNGVIDNGIHVFSHADDLNISEKRIIKNILVDKHFFDLIVKRIKIENYFDRKNLSTAVDTLLGRKLSYFILQVPNACYVIHKSPSGSLHLFSPYGLAKGLKAGWILCKDLKRLKKRLRRITRSAESFHFYNFEITSIQKAPKDLLLSYKMQEYASVAEKKKEEFGRPFYEIVEWLNVDPVPWTRRTTIAASGNERGQNENMWNSWDIEYTKDLFSLMGNIHQISIRFSTKTRGKQTLGNLVTSIGMMEIYELSEWNAAVVDSILVNGDNYFNECIQDITEENYEIAMDDMKTECSIFPFAFDIQITPIVEGTMFLVRPTQFNLFKALRYFFNNIDRRCGIICSKKSATIKRHVAFGKLKESEYFMFDCECIGSPMFLEGCGVAYILRTTTLNRLLHVLTMTLRGGDFYIWEVKVSELEPIN